MLDKEKSKKSLSYEEAALEIQEKASQLLKLLEGGTNMQSHSLNRGLTVEEEKAFGKVLFEDIFPLVKECFATADRVDFDKAAFHAFAHYGGGSKKAEISVCPPGFFTAVYESHYDTWGGLDTWSGEVLTTKKAAVYGLPEEPSDFSVDWVSGWDQYDGIFADAVKKIGESSSEAKQALHENTFRIVFLNPLGLKGWFGINFEEHLFEECEGKVIKDEYKKWVLKKPMEEKSLGKFCPKCSAPLNPDMLFCYRCGAKASGDTELPQKTDAKKDKVDLTGCRASREFLIEVANRVFEPDEEPYMGEYSGEENRIAAVMEMLKALFSCPGSAVPDKWGNSYDGLIAVKGKLEWSETVDDFSCDGCYDGGCGGPGYYTLTSFIEKISPEKYAKERSSAVASGLAIESTVVGERFTINNDNSDTVCRTTYMKNFQKLSGYYRCYVVHDR